MGNLTESWDCLEYLLTVAYIVICLDLKLHNVAGSTTVPFTRAIPICLHLRAVPLVGRAVQ